MSPRRLTAAALLLPLAAVSTTRADVAVAAADRDNTLIENADGAVSNGAGPQFFAGRVVLGYLLRGVIRFDIASVVPPGSTITGVTVSFYLSQTTTTDRPVSLHRLTDDWGEGTSNAPGGAGADSTPGDATWIHRFYPDPNVPGSGVFWTTPGGDFIANASATIQVGNVLGFYNWGSTPELVADVQGWVDDPTSNFGWLVMGDEAGGTSAKKFEGRSSLTPAFRPYVTITFTPPAPPCPADYDHNGQVQPADIASFVNDWFTSLQTGSLVGDFDHNGQVQPADIAGFVNAWFTALSGGGC